MSSQPFELTPTMVRAGAGAGKTRGLVETVTAVYRHFKRQGNLPRIVLTTFTRKATQELKERLILKACAERDPDLLQFVSDPSKLHVSTIHGLLSVFLRQVGHLAGLDSGFQIVSESEAEALARLSLREAILTLPAGLRWLEVYGFERILEMCRRYEVARREAGQVRPATLAELQAAVASESERWKAGLKELAQEIAAGVDEPSWQAFANGLSTFVENWAGDAAGLEDLPSKPRRSKKQVELEDWHARSEEAIKDFKKAYEREGWKADLWPDFVAGWSEFSQLGETFADDLRQRKEVSARFEMADLELKSLEILREKPFLGTVFGEEWDFWLIDEYQDTSPLQIACLEALIAGRPRYCVGDPQQSIYLFRGADVGVFDRTQSEILVQGGRLQELRRNYRSEPDVLMFINDFMNAISHGFMAMEPRSEPVPKRSCATIVRASDGDQELGVVVERVGELLQAGAALEQICVLGRTHRNLMDVSRALKDFGYPTHVHSSRGFAGRREVMDARALWRFLVNPHDNLNLLKLLRSPWFFGEDWQLAEWMKDRPKSLWRRLISLNQVPESVLRLREAQTRMNEVGLVRAFEEQLVASGLLDLSLVNDLAGRKESNLWKLILQARELEREGGASLLDFMDDAAFSDPLDSAEGDATSAQEPGCINLMTIHGAKGLEFEHVILPRMGEAPRTSQTNSLEADQGRFHFPLWNEDEGRFVASPLDDLATRRRARREIEEFDRWLYVALTRAKSTLTLTSVRNPDSQSWAARSPVFRRDAGEVITSHYRFIVEDREMATPLRYSGRQTSSIGVRQRCSLAEQPKLERYSVTALLDQSKKSTPPRPMATEDLVRRWQAQRLGTLIHKAFEALRFGHRSNDFDEPVAYVLGLTDPPIRELIAVGETEWGFQVQSEKGVVEGQIDLWAKYDGRIFVVDYKSGSPAESETAFRQLELYSWALRRFGHQEPIEMVVIYPLAKTFEIRQYHSFSRSEDELGRPEATR